MESSFYESLYLIETNLFDSSNDVVALKDDVVIVDVTALEGRRIKSSIHSISTEHFILNTNTTTVSLLAFINILMEDLNALHFVFFIG